MGDHRVASPIVCEGHSAGLDLRNRTGAKQRPRQSRRPSAAKRIIRAEVPKDTGPVAMLLVVDEFEIAAAIPMHD
jgi:hypothetical protein